MKRVLIAALLLMALRVCCAEDFGVRVSGDWEYIKNTDGTAYITEYKSDADQLEVPDTLDGCPVTGMSFYAFYECESLVSVTLPDSLKLVSGNPFYNCAELVKITVSPAGSHLAVVDGVLFSKDGTRLIACPQGRRGSSYTVPEGTKEIGESAFRRCGQLTDIFIPDSVTIIDDSAFFMCGGLTEMNLPDSVTVIGRYAFSHCTALGSMRLPDGITSLSEAVFSGCTGLTEVTLPAGLTEIGGDAFLRCGKLTHITLPCGVTSIGERAFMLCGSLTGLILPDSVTSIGNHAFDMCENLESLTLPDSVTSIGDSAFSNCGKLTAKVGSGSYAAEYCRANDIPYTCPDSPDRLNG